MNQDLSMYRLAGFSIIYGLENTVFILSPCTFTLIIVRIVCMSMRTFLLLIRYLHV